MAGENLLERALKLKAGDLVTSTDSCVAPERVTRGKQYRLVGNPVPKSARQIICEALAVLTQAEEFNSLFKQERPIANVYFPIIDDAGKRVDVSYCVFSGF